MLSDTAYSALGSDGVPLRSAVALSGFRTWPGVTPSCAPAPLRRVANLARCVLPYTTAEVVVPGQP